MEGIHSKESKYTFSCREKWKPEVGHFDVEKVRKYRDVIYKRFTASVTFARDDKSIADISQVRTRQVRKRKCSVKVEIPLSSEVILEETIDSMDSQDANSTVEDFKCEMECEQVSQEQIVLEEEPQGQNSPIKLKESVSVVEG
ncbi:unnamed protein product [Allacma fusca]|uniref:Uncharacterized protein n=1 Tax=Allacma fusca TaxID=39272 RepID=A0A8J2JV72_9HEXA|nr:unnamed protein product [Allacma fusca]